MQMPRQPQTPIRVYVLDTGVIASTDYAMWSPSAAPGTHQEMSVRSYLVVHPDGVLLWDTGIADAISAKPAGEPIVDTVVFRVPRTLREQLEQIGHDPGQIDLVGLSHMHIDHVGNLDQFDARVVMQQAEYEAAYGPDPEALTYIPEAYANLDRERIETVVGEHDVFSDGTVIMTPLPGHTPGHQGLLVALPETGPLLFAGDISYSARDYADSAVRPGNVDVEASRRSIDAAKSLERDRGATVWLHHDMDAQRDVRLAPAVYT